MPRRRGAQRKYFYPGVPEEPGYYVYELWSGDCCLYVGRVGNSGPGKMYNRLGHHRFDKPWWPEVTQIVVSAYGSHEEIAAEEPLRIFELEPLHNRMYAAKCRKGHSKAFIAENYERGGAGRQCSECQREWHQQWQQSPEYKAWAREYRQRPEVKQRAAEYSRIYHAQPEIRAQRQAYWRVRNAKPEVKAAQREREKGRGGYYAERNGSPAVKEYKRRWAARAARLPGPGQAGLF